jgi:hypothetical protein
MRHDRAKVNRLRSFLSWKDVRKNAKDASGDQVEDVVEETNTGNNEIRSHESPLTKTSRQIASKYY